MTRESSSGLEKHFQKNSTKNTGDKRPFYQKRRYILPTIAISSTVAAVAYITYEYFKTQ
jgi:hypothetical protein